MPYGVRDGYLGIYYFGIQHGLLYETVVSYGNTLDFVVVGLVSILILMMGRFARRFSGFDRVLWMLVPALFLGQVFKGYMEPGFRQFGGVGKVLFRRPRDIVMVGEWIWLGAALAILGWLCLQFLRSPWGQSKSIAE